MTGWLEPPSSASSPHAMTHIKAARVIQDCMGPKDPVVGGGSSKYPRVCAFAFCFVCSKLEIGFNVWRKGTGTLFPDRSRHPRWLTPITGRSNPNQATAAGSRPRKSFLFCLTHEVIPGSSSAGDRVSRCGRAPRLSCASWCFCWSVKTWSRGSSNGLVVNNVDSSRTRALSFC